MNAHSQTLSEVATCLFIYSQSSLVKFWSGPNSWRAGHFIYDISLVNCFLRFLPSMYNKCIFSTILSTVDLSARKGSGSSLKPSSFCLKPSQTVDLTLYGVSEHMQRRGKEHDRWTYESTAVLWKIVMEEATKGDPTSVHTPSTVSVQPIQRLSFQ